jgi:hypothetical protein
MIAFTVGMAYSLLNGQRSISCTALPFIIGSQTNRSRAPLSSCPGKSSRHRSRTIHRALTKPSFYHVRDALWTMLRGSCSEVVVMHWAAGEVSMRDSQISDPSSGIDSHFGRMVVVTRLEERCGTSAASVLSVGLICGGLRCPRSAPSVCRWAM